MKHGSSDMCCDSQNPGRKSAAEDFATKCRRAPRKYKLSKPWLLRKRESVFSGLREAAKVEVQKTAKGTAKEKSR